MPEEYSYYLGKSYSKAEILEHIKKKDEVYDIIARCEREYFDALKSGELAKFVMEHE